MTVIPPEGELPDGVGVDEDDGPQHQLDLNGLDLIAGTGPEGYLIEALADDTTWGNPEAIVTEVMSQLLDGSLASVDSYDNREVVINLAVSGDDGNALAAGEAALIAAARGVDGRGLLTWVPPAAGAEPAVFEVVYARLDRTPMNDMQERDDVPGGPERQWTLNLECKPFARSSEPMLVEGLPVSGGGATVPITDGSTTTGWSTSTVQRIRRNISTNPSIETSTDGWGAATGTGQVASTTAAHLHGSRSLDGIRDNTSNRMYVSHYVTLIEGVDVYKVQVGMRWTATVNPGGSVSSTAKMGILVRFFNASGNQVGNSLTVGTASVNRNAWRDIGVEGYVTAPTGAVRMAISPWLDKPGGNNVFRWDIWVDRVVITEHIARRDGHPYFDGDYTDTSLITYAWDGTPELSTSTATYAPPTVTSDGSQVTLTTAGAIFPTLDYTGDLTPPEDSPYLRVTGTVSWDLSSPRADQVTLQFYLDGQAITPTMTVLSNGTWSAVFYRDTPASTFSVRATLPNAAFDIGSKLSVDNMEFAAKPVDSTGRQTSRNIPVYGSMRTEADVMVTSATADGTPVPIGAQALVYTVPVEEGLGTPDLRRWRTAGNAPRVDATRISGAQEDLPNTEATALTFKIPANQIRKGTHALYANIGCTTAAVKNIHWSATVNTAYTSHTETGQVSTKVGPWLITPLGHVTLPTTDVNPAAEATITLKLWNATTSGAPVLFDEAWVFNVDEGQVSLIDTSGGVSMVELASATIDYPNPSCWIGDADSSINTIHAGARATFDQHRFPPGVVSVFTVASSSTSVSTSLSYYPRWHTHPSVIVLEQDDEEDIEDGEEGAA